MVASSTGIAKHRKKARRYEIVTDEKAGGASYTPTLLAEFVAKQILSTACLSPEIGRLRVLDPAVGDGELLLSILKNLPEQIVPTIELHGFETDENAIEKATVRIRSAFPKVKVCLRRENFLEYVLDRAETGADLFAQQQDEPFDLIIANPPYVRTQIMGAAQAQMLARQFGLNGRVDLYHAFLLGIAKVLRPGCVAGVIVSNRFMTTKSGASVRRALKNAFDIAHVWDLGDTKLFDAAVLPAVLLLHGKISSGHKSTRFTSVYETADAPDAKTTDAMTAVLMQGIIEIADGRRFNVKHGQLDLRGPLDDIWRVATQAGDQWLSVVEENTWGTFRDIGKIRVGIKTCADSVFIRDDWHELPSNMQPELLRPLVTHHVARRYKASESAKPLQVVYPHQAIGGFRKAADLAEYPRTRVYLESFRKILESRRYVIEGGRKWYEIWVPQDPAMWDAPKLVFRDISERPTFWLDQAGSIVNGDCYWLAAESSSKQNLLWLALGVGNSTFIEAFYDHRFNNKLCSGPRRFMTQYVEQFPLPNPNTDLGNAIIKKARELYDLAGAPEANGLENELNRLVWESFGLNVEKISG